MQVCNEEKVVCDGGSVLVWAGIYEESRIKPALIENDTLNGIRYVEEIINEHVSLCKESLGENDHITCIVQDYLNHLGIIRGQVASTQPQF